MKVLLVALSATPMGDELVGHVEALKRVGASVHLVSRAAPVPALDAVLDGRTAIGAPVAIRRLPGPLSKVRVEPNRLVDAVRLARGRRYRALVASADALVAVDQTAVPAVWLAARRRPDALAIQGLATAVTRLSARLDGVHRSGTEPLTR